MFTSCDLIAQVFFIISLADIVTESEKITILSRSLDIKSSEEMAFLLRKQSSYERNFFLLKWEKQFP